MFVYYERYTTISFASEGGTRIAALLRLVLVSIVVARWSEDLFMIFITFRGCLYCC
jgi:hypothetical protein